MHPPPIARYLSSCHTPLRPALDRRRSSRGPAQRPDAAGPARPLRAGGGGGDPRARRASSTSPTAGSASRHVLEHMFFKGTPTRGVGQIARETKAAGGYLNASTTYDHTTYFMVLPAAALARALDIQADALRHRVIDAGELGPRAAGHHPGSQAQARHARARDARDAARGDVRPAPDPPLADRHRGRSWPATPATMWRATTGPATCRSARSSPSWAPCRSRRRSPAARGLRRLAAGAGRGGSLARRSRRAASVRARTLRGDVTRAELALGWRTVPPLHPDACRSTWPRRCSAPGAGSWLYRVLREPGHRHRRRRHQLLPDGESACSASRAECEPERVRQALAGIAQRPAGSRSLGPAGATSNAPARCCSPAGRAAWNRWRAAPSRWPRPRRWATSSCSTRSTSAWPPSPPRRCGRGASGTSLPESVAAVVYLPDGEGDDLTPERLAAAFAVAAAHDHRAAPEARSPAPPAAASRRTGRAPPRCCTWRSPALDLLIRRKPGVPLVTLGVLLPRDASSRPRRRGSARSRAVAVRGAGRFEARRSPSPSSDWAGPSAPSAGTDWLGFEPDGA